MARESHPLSRTARSAFALLAAQQQAQVETLCGNILDDMDLSAHDGWRVGLETGDVYREVADAASPVPESGAG